MAKFDDFLKENAKLVVTVVLSATALYVMFDGKIISFEVNKYIIVGGLVAVYWVFNMLHTDVVLLLETESQEEKAPEVPQRQQFQQPQRQYTSDRLRNDDKPFQMRF